MEKMNQVSVSEFFAKSKEEMYDDAVAMVEKYNRLVDICNDSAERMAELMAKDDINEFKKELQSKEIGEFKIQKLADIVVWADGIIRAGGYYEEKYKSDSATAYCHVKAHELWRIRDVALESMERQTVYSNALNNDIADKAAKINLLEKEIEGRKEGYYALKTQMDNLKKEYEETCRTKELDLKNHQKRDMALVDELAKKNDEIKDLKGTIEYYKNQERIRTDQLRATERKVEELWKEIEKFTKGEDDDYGKSGFKRYIEHLIEEEERAVPERFKERLNEEITAIFTKEEETEVKGVGRTNSGRYPWGAKVNDIPCGEDAIE